MTIPFWLKKARENQAKKEKKSSFESLAKRIESSKNTKNPAIIMDIWEEVERLSFRDFKNLENILSKEALDFLKKVILK